MSWWSTSWLPSIPSIDFSLPSAIQKRFISFTLRRTLGHLLKPGQLDIPQVDSQIGSGYVQIRDVELDNDAINAMLAGLPLELHDGSLGKVTVRIPWPNPLTSSIGLSLESLHLTFNVVPTVATSSASAKLAESMVSVAESFVHDELNDYDEAALRESVYSDAGSYDPVPGGLDPFLTDREGNKDSDPSGVGLFATLVERLLARFEFDAKDLKVTLVHVGHSSFTLTVPSIRYHTELKDNVSPTSSTPPKEQSPDGVVRTIQISGVNVTTRNLRPLSPVSMTSPAASLAAYHSSVFTSSATATPQPSPPHSPTYSDSSDMDEDTTMMMSQSIVGLPIRPASPASSVASSMYQSAISNAPLASMIQPRPPSPPQLATAPVTPPIPPSAPPRLQLITREIEDESIISFGNDPIQIRLVVPLPSRLSRPDRSPRTPGSSTKELKPEDSQSDKPASKTPQSLKLDVTVGVIAVALRARHARGILEIAELWTSHSPPARPRDTSIPAQQSSPSILDRIEASFHCRGIVILLLPTSKIAPAKDPLLDFYSRPLVPPQLPHGYVRIYVDSISATMSLLPLPSLTPPRGPSVSPGSTITGNFNIDDISAFVFLLGTNSEVPSGPHASPILITDPHLGSQYPSVHVHPDLREANAQHLLPAFDVVDWTDETRNNHTAKLSTWRTRLPQGQAQSNPATPVNRTKDLASSSISHSPIVASPARHSPFSRAIPTIHPGHTPAVNINISITSVVSRHRSSRAESKSPESGMDVDIQLAPIHIFCDTSLLLNRTKPADLGEPLLFLEEITTRDSHPSFSASVGEDESDEEDEEDDADTPPATPYGQRRERSAREQERDRERERQRLERLVMEDLDLQYDYRQSVPQKARPQVSRVDSWHKKQSKRHKTRSKVSVALPVLRIEIRNPPPPQRPSRSGALILDIHDIRLSPGAQETSSTQGTARFADEDILPAGMYHSPATRNATQLLSASWQRLTFAYQAVDQGKAQIILSLGSLSLDAGSTSHPEGIAIGSPPRASNVPQARPQIIITKTDARQSLTNLTTTALSVDIPSVHVHLRKGELDGLQQWADDLSQLAERALNPSAFYAKADFENTSDPSLIGSRFFNKTRRSQGSGTDSAASTVVPGSTSAGGETNVKVSISEVAVTLALPRETGTRPLNIMATDIDVLLELKPEGKDETVITLGVMDICVRETSDSNDVLTFLGLTTPRNMINTAQPLVKLRFTSLVVSDSIAKESRIKLTVCGATYTLHPNIAWISDIAKFVKAPPGVFESVVPSERTRLSIKVIDSSVRMLCPTYPGAMVLHVGELDFTSVMVGNLPETTFNLTLHSISLLLIDDLATVEGDSATSTKTSTMSRVSRSSGGVWKLLGYALIAELSGLEVSFAKRDDVKPADIRVTVPRGSLRLHLCADTGTALGGFIGDFSTVFASPTESSPAPVKPKKVNSVEIAPDQRGKRDLTASLDEHAFRRTIPQVGAAPDMVDDDLPTNLDYLDDSFSATAGLRELDDDDLDEFSAEEVPVNITDHTGLLSAYGGETIRLFDPQGLKIVENYFETLPPEATDESAQYGDTTLKLRVRDCDVTVFLYAGYDWARTRRIIEEEAKEMRKRLAKIRQLVANGQAPDPRVEETNTLLFNSVYIGLDHDIDELEPGALLAAIDEELNEDLETASQSSWQSLKPQPTSPRSPESRPKRSKKNLLRSKGPSIEFRLEGLSAEVDNYRSHESLASRILVTIRDAEILDHIKTSTWSKFLTSLHTDTRGNIRESGSNMVRVELRKVYPVPGNPTQEARLRAKILPLRLHVDQDALDFMKKFFSFKDPDAVPSPPSDPADEIFFQQAEVFPVDIKLDYKPRRVDYRALREGKTIELMNFFHFDGAEMTLRHITLNGITGWARVGDLLNDLWTPDVKATQLVEVISGVAPIRSVVNVGSGVADLVLLPIAQYKKDGRVVRGLQKGTTSFVKSTATEAIKLGARLATGTQVILEQAENVIGGQFDDPVTAEALQFQTGSSGADDILTESADVDDLISRYAEQPAGVTEGVKSAYKSLRRNLTSAAQTILAVPMEVYERSGNEGAVRAVVRAVPIAVLKPMIGASEAVSKTLLGLHNTLDPNVRTENEAKYKQR
ncbi:hypothetical protein BDW22DRAFT_1370943 [Trametopsis cervina]|nr:hypothetical protein BDW22DRAFT_1370943 [Trametopsis cervina]